MELLRILVARDSTDARTAHGPITRMLTRINARVALEGAEADRYNTVP